MPEPGVRELALDPPRAFGPPLGRARIRTSPEDFLVDEQLGFAPDGEGSHWLMRVRKRGANTVWVARQLARAAGCAERDVGYAGLKDRHAVATQWFSVPAGAKPHDWEGFAGEEFSVLEAHRHRRKLPRGALAGNTFRIRLRALTADREALGERIDALRRRGVPNYFGAQRFGREGANLDDIARLAELPRALRSMVLSAARSLVFNAALAARVADGSWERLEAGDVANLDARGSTFAVPVVEEPLGLRASRLEIHPTGPLWGDGELATGERVRILELAAAARFAAAREACIAAGMRQERRSLRLAVRDVEYDRGEELIAFRLTKGAYATSVLRELVEWEGAHAGGNDGD